MSNTNLLLIVAGGAAAYVLYHYGKQVAENTARTAQGGPVYQAQATQVIDPKVAAAALTISQAFGIAPKVG